MGFRVGTIPRERVARSGEKERLLVVLCKSLAIVEPSCWVDSKQGLVYMQSQHALGLWNS